MTLLTLVSRFAIAFFLVSILRRIARALTDPLRAVPGPLLARFTRLWHAKAVLKRDLQKTNIALHRKYGPVVRIAPGFFSIDSLDAVTKIYGTHDVWPKSTYYHVFQEPPPERANALSANDPTLAAALRKKYTPALNSFSQYEPQVDECLKLLQDKLGNFADEKRITNVGSWVICFAFDTMAYVTYSDRIGFLDAGEDVAGIVNSCAQRQKYASLVGLWPKFHPYGFALVNLLAKSTGQYDYVQRLTEMHIEAYQSTGAKQLAGGKIDYLTRYMQAHYQDPENFTYFDMCSGPYINMVAGADTLWCAFNATLSYVVADPNVVETLRKELDSRAKDGQVSDPIQHRETLKLPYLQAVVKEGLRMHPVAGTPLWRVVPEPGAEICGKFFPAGTTVGINAWVAHHSSTFAPDPDVFRPERWLKADPERLKEMERYYIPFSIGPRMCQGRSIALIQLLKLIAQLIRHFDFEIVNKNGDALPPDQTKDIRWDTQYHFTVGHSGFKARVRKRLSV